MNFLKIVKKGILCLVAMLFCIIHCYADSMTPVHTNDAKYTRGVSNTCYWIASTASSYTTWIGNAASLWNYNGYNNPIHMTAVSSNYATHMDFYGHYMADDSLLSSNTNAYTSYYNSSGVQIAPTTDYFFTRIIINLNGNASQGTMCHEMGHSFGLAHSSNTYSIMYVPASSRMVSSPQQCDVSAINYLYDYEE